MARDRLKSKISSFSVIGGGNGAVFHIESEEGRALDLELPAQDIPYLMLFASQADAEMKARRGSDDKFAIPCDWWEVGTATPANIFFLTFKVEGGGEICFKLPMNVAAPMAETLMTLSGALPENKRSADA